MTVSTPGADEPGGATHRRNPVAALRALLPASGTGRASLFAFLGMLLFESAKEIGKDSLGMSMTPWESHALTIAFSTVTVAIIAYHVLRHQARTLAELGKAKAEREFLEARQTALAESESRYRQLVESSPEAIAVHRDGLLLYANSAACELFGLDDVHAVQGVALRTLLHPDDHATVLSPPRDGVSRTHCRVLSANAVREADAASVLVPYEGAPAVQTLLRDITHRRELEAKLRHEAFHDALTGLANRALFRDRLAHALAVVSRLPGFSGVAVLFIDLDDFKTVNDSFGHPVGDELVRVLAARLRQAVRSGDTVARLGGDEFAVLLEGLRDEREAMIVVDRLQDTLAGPVSIDGRSICITASAGIAFAVDGDSGDTLLRNADVALYEAKDAGKARCAKFEPAMYTEIMARLELETDLRRAVTAPEEAGFSIVFQPIVQLVDERVRGIEVLLRWTHERRGEVSPAMFIPVAESTGAIVGLGAWVLGEACRQLAQWQDEWRRAGIPEREWPTMSVNVSGRQLAEPTFVVRVEAALARTGVRPHGLTLEITESVMLGHTADTLAALHQLRALGVRLAVDDFGTGYSSLSYLQVFPVDVLKIDRSFVEAVAEGASNAALARAIVALGQSLRLQTVAEGIETPAQREALQALGCELGQGFLFARPQSAELARAWIREHQTRTTRGLWLLAS